MQMPIALLVLSVIFIICYLSLTSYTILGQIQISDSGARRRPSVPIQTIIVAAFPVYITIAVLYYLWKHSASPTDTFGIIYIICIATCMISSLWSVNTAVLIL